MSGALGNQGRASTTSETVDRGHVVLRSPAVTFCLWIVVSLGLYALGWSHLYGQLRIDTIILLSLGFGVFLWIAAHGSPWESPLPAPVGRRVTVLITAYYLAAFAANGGIPLLQIVRGQPYDVYGFGLPMLHVPVLAATGYFAVRMFRSYLTTRSPRQLATFLWFLALLGLIGNRSALSFTVFACTFLFIRRARISPQRIAAVAAALGVFLLAFGQFGTTRLSFQIEQETGGTAPTDAISQIAQPSQRYTDLGLSADWLWPYMYATSPIGNLNSAFEYSQGSACGPRCDIPSLVIYEFLPDIAGVRIAEALDLEEFNKQHFLRAPSLTASTTFGSAVGYAGPIGAGAVLAGLAAGTAISLRLVRRSSVQEEGLALLATLLFFSFFENMWAYSPLALQLVYALVAARRRHTSAPPHPA